MSSSLILIFYCMDRTKYGHQYLIIFFQNLPYISLKYSPLKLITLFLINTHCPFVDAHMYMHVRLHHAA